MGKAISLGLWLISMVWAGSDSDLRKLEFSASAHPYTKRSVGSNHIPQYPPEARLRRVQGEVEITWVPGKRYVRFLPFRRLHSVTVFRTENSILTNAALQSARSWKLGSGKPVRIVYLFRLIEPHESYASYALEETEQGGRRHFTVQVVEQAYPVMP